jgi:hypothetical protein
VTEELRDLVLFDELHPEGPRGTEHLCGSCGQCFGSLRLFDAHQDVDYRRTPPVRCRDPRELRVNAESIPVAEGDPLVQDDRGTWQTPAGLARHRAATETLRRSGH